jgi:hypothetical protein
MILKFVGKYVCVINDLSGLRLHFCSLLLLFGSLLLLFGSLLLLFGRLIHKHQLLIGPLGSSSSSSSVGGSTAGCSSMGAIGGDEPPDGAYCPVGWNFSRAMAV